MQDICENIRTAIEHGRTDIIRSILEACENGPTAEGITKEKILNQPLLEEGTFLSYASKTNQADIVRTLLSCGADPAIQNANGHNAVDLASSDIIRRIYIEELLRATAASEIEKVIQLLDAGIHVNSWDSQGSKNTPLHWAVCYGNKDVITCLIDRGADINAENGCGAIPLHDAVNRGDIAICHELLQAGANPLIRAVKGTFAGKTPYDLSRGKQTLHGLLQKFLSNFTSNDNETMHSPIALFSEGNFSQKSISSNMSQLSIESNKSSEPVYDIPLRESGKDSPNKTATEKEGIYYLLWPQPKTICELKNFSPPFVIGKELFISIIQGSESIHRILDVWEVSRTHLLELGHDVKIGEVQPSSGKLCSENKIECIVNKNLFNVSHGYQLHISQNSIKVCAGSLPGLHYAVCTFVQILRLSKKDNASETCEIEPVLIKDEPRFIHRGILLDISPRGRIPTLEYLLHMVDLWSSLKISHLHLYSRLTSACDWQLCYTKSEMVTLDRYCRDRHLDLVPTLDVDSNVGQHHLTQMWPIFQELLAVFPSLSYVHVGPRLASLLVQPDNFDQSLSVNETIETDMSEVYKSYSCLQELWHILNLNSSTTLLLCSNGLHSKLEFHYIPSNIILVEYGFQADYDFSEWTEVFKIAGGNILSSSGTASYNSLAGCPASTYMNTKNAIKAAIEQDSIGIVVAHWSGSHHLTPHPFAWIGYLIAAGMSWNSSTDIDIGIDDNYDVPEVSGLTRQKHITKLLDIHIFQDSECKIGSAILELGRLDTLVLTLSKNQSAKDLQQIPDNRGSTLYRLLTDPDNVNLEYLSADLFAKMTKQIKRISHSLYEGNLSSKFASMEIQELQLTADLMLTACKIGRTLIVVGINPNSNMGLAVINLGVCNLPPTFRTDIANKMLAHIEQYKGSWLQRHLPQGLQSSLLVLTSTLHRFVPET
ncbi:Tankyrase-1 [Vespula squamosa]|uniref:Tankyrase-1 n=1 Tax=Vespula squamosa TaxID=30214 RepID=A0ABD2A381_VESSQ